MSSYFLVLETWQYFLLQGWATFGLREEATETLTTAWRSSSVSLDLNFDLLKFIVENSFSHKQPKRYKICLNILESSRKVRGRSTPSSSSFLWVPPMDWCHKCHQSISPPCHLWRSGDCYSCKILPQYASIQSESHSWRNIFWLVVWQCIGNIVSNSSVTSQL